MPRAILGELTNQWPLNPGNRKVIVFTAFADTARYLYDQLAPWVKTAHGIDAALVTGTGGNRTTLDGLHRDLSSILTVFGGHSAEGGMPTPSTPSASGAGDE